jgi:arsenate reductase (thioredoxin)
MRVKKKVLFLCIGNSCRSQMAEGFARRYGSDIMEVRSAGLAPASIVQSLTKKVMEQKNINIDDQYPKDLVTIPMAGLDLMINMSGSKVSLQGPMQIQEWQIEDPIGKSEELYIQVRDQIENLVMRLILQLRKEARSLAVPKKEPAPTPTSKVARPKAGRRFLRTTERPQT